MKTRKLAPLFSTLALACFAGFPPAAEAQTTGAEFAYVYSSTDCPSEGACGPLVTTTGLAFLGGHTTNPNDRTPTWSPDGARIAFERDGEIMVIAIAGGGANPANLSNHPAQDSSPDWSPDGTKIAFASDRDGQAELYVMNSNGSGVVRLTDGIGFAGQPDWSPDSARIAFDCVIDAGNADICVINADGSGFQRLTTDPAADNGPTWSPTGARIAFVTGRYSSDSTGLGGQLALMNPDGSGVSQLGATGFDPDWSPDGARIAFVQYVACVITISGYELDSSCAAVYVINADGTGEVLIAGGEGYYQAWDPAWKPVGGPPGPAVALSPSSLGFGSQSVGSTSQAKQLSLVNTGTSPLAISSIAISGDFSQSNNCGSSVAAGASCYITVWFKPTAVGPRSGAVTIMDNATGSPHAISLGGTGNAPPVASFTSTCMGLECSFNGFGSSDPGGSIASHAWSFGDGATGAGGTVSHTYPAPGTYTVTLTVTDDAGATGAKSKNVTLTGPAAMHVGDLDRTRTKQRQTWTATVTARVHHGSHGGVAKATISGSWSHGGTGSCTTSSSGQCTVSSSGIPKTTGSVTFTVGNLTHATLPYVPASNHDPDGDSNGTSITVSKP